MSALTRIRQDLRTRFFTVFSEDVMGLRGLRLDILDRCYPEDVLAPVPDARGPVKDRYRAKDFCVYRRFGDKIELTPAKPDLMQLGDGRDARPVAHVSFCTPYAGLIEALLHLIPPEAQHPQGTWGVHTFRSFSNVVNSPHQDGFEYGGVYCLDLVGGGANSYLIPIAGGPRPLEHQLQPGEILLFKDSKFLHGATPLEGNEPRRDALVLQFDAPEDLEAARKGGLL